MSSKNKLLDIAFIRAIAIIMVVAFHAYGMMYAAAHFPALKDTYYQMYFTLNQCVFINIAMPMFVFYRNLIKRGWKSIVICQTIIL